MNRILTLVFSLICSISFAQNWQTVNSKRVANYSLELIDKTVFETVAIDSLVMNGSDSIFYNFKKFYGDDINTECENLTDTSWIGTQVRINTLGNNFFTNKYGDEIQIKTLADSGETWDFSPFISANVIQKSYDTILDNIMDSVKTISLSNDNEIIISKNYGLIKSIRFGYFPDDDREIILAGIDEVGGIEVLTSADIFDFEIGDEFHLKYRWYNYYDPEINIKYINRLIYKDYSLDNDTIILSYDRCYSKKVGDVVTNHIDTLVEKHKLANEYSFNPILDTLNEYGHGFSFQYLNDSYNKKHLKLIIDDFEYNGNNCWKHRTNYHHTFTLAKGIGKVEDVFDSGYDDSLEKLVYYKKSNNEEWGNSLGSCETLSKNELIQNQINFYPNPVTDVLNISNQNKLKLYVEIYNSTGQQVYSDSFLKSSQINTSDWQKGFYIIKINNSKGEPLKVEKFYK